MIPNTSDQRFSRTTLGWIIAGALFLRVLWASLVPVMPISDSVAYDTFARMLVEHGVFGFEANKPFAFWPPGTSFIYSSVYWLFGFHYPALVAINIALSIGIIIISARIAERFFGARIGLATAVVMAVWPTLVIYPTIIASELPYLFLSILALDLWTMRGDRFALRAIAAGIVLGLAALVRPLALVLPAVYAGSVLAQHRFARAEFIHQFRLALLAGCAMACVIAPWTLRNLQLYGEPVLISTNGGITFWMGNTPGTNGGYMDIPEELKPLRDNEQNKILGARAWQYIRDKPAEFVARCVRKLAVLYSNESIGVHWNADGIALTFGPGAVTPLKRTTQLSWAFIVVLAAVGFIALARQDFYYVLMSPVVVSIGFYTIVYSITVSQDRYHLSFASQMAILAAAGALSLKQLFANSRSKSLAMGTNPGSA